MGTYVHLSGKQTGEAILKAYGIEVNESGISEPKPSVCPRCGEINPSNGTYFRKCWLTPSTEAALELKVKKSHIQAKLEIKGTISPQVQAMIENMPET